MTKITWQYKTVIKDRQVYARKTRSEIIVRVEKVGDTTKFAEYVYPKIFGLFVAAEQAALEVPDKDIKDEENV